MGDIGTHNAVSQSLSALRLVLSVVYHHVLTPK